MTGVRSRSRRRVDLLRSYSGMHVHHFDLEIGQLDQTRNRLVWGGSALDFKHRAIGFIVCWCQAQTVFTTPQSK